MITKNNININILELLQINKKWHHISYLVFLTRGQNPIQIITNRTQNQKALVQTLHLLQVKNGKIFKLIRNNSKLEM